MSDVTETGTLAALRKYSANIVNAIDLVKAFGVSTFKSRYIRDTKCDCWTLLNNALEAVAAVEVMVCNSAK